MEVARSERTSEGDVVPAAFRLWDRPSLVSLLAANAVVLVAILGFGASGFDVLVLYWFETIIIGFFAVAKVGIAALVGHPFDNRLVHVTRGATLLLSFFAIVFFIGKFGAFVAGLGMWLLATHAMLAGSEAGADVLFEALTRVGGILSACGLALFASHSMSFVVNYLGRREFRDAGIIKLLFWPYGRCVWMLATLLVALGLASNQQAMAQSAAFTLGVVGVKLLCDLAGHLLERRLFGN